VAAIPAADGEPESFLHSMLRGSGSPIVTSEVVVNTAAVACLDQLHQGSKGFLDSGTFDVAAAAVLDDLHT